jgi:hypothetical protein
LVVAGYLGSLGIMDTLFVVFGIAGGAVFAHIALSQLLRALLRWNTPLALELFAVPNAPLAPDSGFRLLRVGYFLPWRPAPSAMQQQPLVTRILFLATRIMGLAGPVLILTFFAGAFYVGTH